MKQSVFALYGRKFSSGLSKKTKKILAYCSSLPFLGNILRSFLSPPYNPSFYSVKLRYKNTSVQGVLCGIRPVHRTPKLMPHEDYYPYKVKGKKALFACNFFQTKPLLGIYYATSGDTLLNYTNNTDDPLPIDDQDLIKDFTCFIKNQEILIGDGHHKLEAYRQYATGKKPEAVPPLPFLLINAAHNDVAVHAQHRIVKGISPGTFQNAMYTWEQLFNIEQISPNQVPAELSEQYIGIVYGQKGYLLRFEKDMYDRLPEDFPWYPYADISVVHQLIIDEGLGIPVRHQKRSNAISYTLNTHDLSRKSADHPDKIWIFTKNITLEKLFHIGKSGKVLPPKSTYFQPRVKRYLITEQFV